ncbi:50S ribosomal protein L6 [Candidatus Kaiserbacteria bacterium]|nr:50S ribosomal protein L6 [Candidatus Kaiserbacteria bacterium]
MSRIAKKPIAIPAGVTVAVSADSTVSVKGKGGELKRTFRPLISIKTDSNTVILEPKSDSHLAKALWGTYAAHIRNMMEGVTKPYVKQLLIEGVGYRATVQGTKIVLAVGFSHPVELAIPAGITVTAEKGVITITGIDKDAVGQFAANVRAKKVPEPYKGKGIRYSTEVIRRKQGKKVVG